MKTKHIIRALFTGLLIALCGCSDYLDVKPKGKIIPETADDYATIIHYWLYQIENGRDDVIIPSAEKMDHFELFAEDLDATLASSFYSTYLYVGTNINNNSDDYETLYSVIKDCNMIIGNMEDNSSETAKNILGTAWSIRSVCYLNLMKMYCEPYDPLKAETMLGLPLVNEFDMEAKPARANLKETALFIEKGFQKALSYHVTNDDYLFTSSVTTAFMARFYFWIQDWDNTISMSLSILDKYPLLEAAEYANAMNQKLKKTPNVIIRSFTNEDELGSMGYVSAQADMKTRPVSRNLVELFTLSGADIRKDYSFSSKRSVSKVLTGKFRSEELYLMIAEAYAHKNETLNALKYLDDLRSRRITENYEAYTEENLPEVYSQHITVDATGAPLTKLMSAILCERRMELFLEGDRWFELKRNGSPEFWVAANGKKYVNEKYLYTFPIPIKDIRLFPGLIIQNPGY